MTEFYEIRSDSHWKSHPKLTVLSATVTRFWMAECPITCRVAHEMFAYVSTGKKYTSCTKAGHTEAWCYATDGQWGNCNCKTTAKCDAKIGPKQGNCPVAKCLAPAKGCTLKTEFTKMGDSGCCPKPCNFVDAKGKKCQPKICPKKMINPNSCKCGIVTATVDGCPVTKCKTDCGIAIVSAYVVRWQGMLVWISLCNEANAASQPMSPSPP